MFGNPNVLTAVHRARLRAAAVPAERPGGPDHDPRRLRRRPRTTCSAPLRSTPSNPAGDDAARFAFIRRRSSNIPIAIPVTVRSGDRLRPALHGLRDHPDWCRCPKSTSPSGDSPPPRSRTSNASPKGSPGQTGRLSGLDDTSCITAHRRSSRAARAVHRQPLGLRPADADDPRRRDLPAPGGLRPRRSSYPLDHRMRAPDLPAGRPGETDHRRGRCTVGPRPRVHRSRRRRAKAASPSQLRAGDLILPARADDQPRRRRRAERLPDSDAELGTNAGALPRQRQGRHDHGRIGVAPGRPDRVDLLRRADARQPVPAVHDRRRLRDSRQADRQADSRPEDRPGSPPSSKICRSCPSNSSKCTSSPPIAGSSRPRRGVPSTRSTLTSSHGTTRLPTRAPVRRQRHRRPARKPMPRGPSALRSASSRRGPTTPTPAPSPTSP